MGGTDRWDPPQWRAAAEVGLDARLPVPGSAPRHRQLTGQHPHVQCRQPGSPLVGRPGARIEDLVVRTPAGVERLNTTPTELIVP